MTRLQIIKIMDYLGELKKSHQELLDILKLIDDNFERPPDPNCSCCKVTPCSDCVSYATDREIWEEIKKVLKKHEPENC